MSLNPHTGDSLVTKPSKAYEDNYDKIFKKDVVCEECGCVVLRKYSVLVDGVRFCQGCAE